MVEVSPTFSAVRKTILIRFIIGIQCHTIKSEINSLIFFSVLRSLVVMQIFLVVKMFFCTANAGLALPILDLMLRSAPPVCSPHSLGIWDQH